MAPAVTLAPTPVAQPVASSSRTSAEHDAVSRAFDSLRTITDIEHGNDTFVPESAWHSSLAAARARQHTSSNSSLEPFAPDDADIVDLFTARLLSAARGLASVVLSSTNELPAESAARLWDDVVNRRVLELVQSPHSPNDQLAGLAAIACLVGLDAVEVARSLYRFWNNVWPMFSAPSRSVAGAQSTLALDDDGGVAVTVLRAAAATAARIVRAGGPAFAEAFVEQEVPGAADLLGPSGLDIVVEDDAPPAPTTTKSRRRATSAALAPRTPPVHHTYHGGSPVSPLIPTTTASGAYPFPAPAPAFTSAAQRPTSTPDLGRYAGVLLLRVLARTLPSFFARHVDVVLEKLGGVLRDTRVFVREAGASLLVVCLTILSERGGESSTFLEQVYAQAKAGVESAHPGVAHGALLAQGALLNGARMFMHPHVPDCTHSTVSKISLASDARVRHAAMRLVPVLAAYDTATFTGSDTSGTSVVGTKTSLFWAMTGLISRLDYPGDRNVAFESIGVLAAAVGADIRPFLDRVMLHVRTTLQSAHLPHHLPSAPPNTAIPKTPSTAAALTNWSGWPFAHAHSPSHPLSEPASSAASDAGPEHPHLPSLLRALRLLVSSSALAPHLLGPLHAVLPDLFACGLSAEMGVFLEEVTEQVPGLAGRVGERLLDVLARTLTGRPFVPCGAPPAPPTPPPQVNGYGHGHSHSVMHGLPGTRTPRTSLTDRTSLRLDFAMLPAVGENGNGYSVPPSAVTTAPPFMLPAPAPAQPAFTFGYPAATIQPHSPATLRLALDVLATFDFGSSGSGGNLLEFVRDAGGPYLGHHVAEVRAAAARCVGGVVRGDKMLFYVSQHAIEIIDSLLGTLVRLGVSDPHPRVREIALTELAAGGSVSAASGGVVANGGKFEFERTLSQAEWARGVVVGVNDENFAVRSAAMGIVGRLAADKNPAYLLPAVKLAVDQLIADLKHAPSARARSDAAQLIGLAVQTATHTLEPYTLPLLDVLLPAASDSAPGVAAAALGALGELSAANGPSVLASGRIDELFRVVLSALADPVARARRDAALAALGNVVSGTGVVIQPLITYPDLMSSLGRLLADPRQHTRELTLRVLGLLGAVDPYRPLTTTGGGTLDEDALQATVVRRAHVDVSVPMGGAPGEEYYLRVAMAVLLELLRDTTKDSAHHVAVEAIMIIFKTQGLSAAVFLPQIIPTFIAVIRRASSRLQEFHLQQVAILVTIIGEHIRTYLQQLLELVHTLWESSPPLRLALAGLLAALAKAMDTELRPHVPQLVPVLLDGLARTERSSTHTHILSALGSLGGCLEPYLALILPSVLSVASNDWTDAGARKAAVGAIERLAERLPLGPMLGRIVHPLVKTLPGADEELRTAIMDALSVLAMRTGGDYALFIPLVEGVRKEHGVGPHKAYDEVVGRLMAGERTVNESELVQALLGRVPDPRAASGLIDLGQARGANISGATSAREVLRAAEVAGVRSAQDWLDWLQRMCSKLLNVSPSPALRSCVQLLGLEAKVATEAARKLLPVSFLSCWTGMSTSEQDSMMSALTTALEHEHTPQDVVMTILDLVESMERQGKPLSIRHQDLAKAAMGCGAYAAALHYTEHDFHTSETHKPRNVETLIDINTKLRQLDSAYGTLTCARDWFDDFPEEQWFEKLGRWGDALTGYSRQAELAMVQGRELAPDVRLGQLRCLNALGEWEALERAAIDAYVIPDMKMRRAVAPLMADGAWARREWAHLEDFVQAMDAQGKDRSFYSAVVAVQRGQFVDAAEHISQCRRLIDPELAGLLLEDYERGYEHMVRAQILSELEEVMDYKQLPEDSPEQVHVRNKWMKRLRGAEANVEVWQKMMHVRSLVVSPRDEPSMWIKFANLCRKNGRLELANRILGQHVNDGTQTATPDVLYSYMKYMWAAGGSERKRAPIELNRLAGELRSDISAYRQRLAAAGGTDTSANDLLTLKSSERLLARCSLKHAQWMQRGDQQWSQGTPDEVLRLISSATSLDPTWWKAWHMWALANIETLGSVETLADYHLDDIDGGILASRAVLAVQGLIKAIVLAKKSTLQDVLRLLTLLFKFGGHQNVSDTIYKGFRKLSVDTWLEVIPQIIARISAPNQLIRTNIHFILTEIGKAHPQALIYALTVAQKSPSKPRQDAARKVMSSMAQTNYELVEQAKSVSQELIRVAILWNELWREGLDTASKLFVERGDVDGMLAVLDPLHDLVEAGPMTADEITFMTSNGRDLEAARQECRNYLASHNPADLDRAWILYTNVYRRLERIPPQPLLNLEQVSPYLLRVRDLILAVPGTYRAGRPVLTIKKVAPQLTVLIKSNKKPRRIAITGSDGQDYEFSLKGHEDIRQDERVMQFFGLANAIFANDADSVKRQLHVQRLSVVPIAPNAGLSGWAQETDTLHHLIEQYRTSRDVLLNLENRLMLQMAPEYDCLTVLQKVEVFEFAMNSTMGMDLYRILWLKSLSATDWLARRTMYTRSVAVTSMLGYVIGLGDRHPSNILIHRGTGKLIHIDFGDCFEVAMKREKYPETVPFRLTRMMVLAMEVATVHGTFRNTSEITLRLMRDHRDSLLAVLEALIYDPLTTWRLSLQTPTQTARSGQASQVMHDVRAEGRRANEQEIFGGDSGELISQAEHRNDRALSVYQRVKNKLQGRDFNESEVLSVQQQYTRLIGQARSEENLCQLYFGWVACW